MYVNICFPTQRVEKICFCVSHTCVAIQHVEKICFYVSHTCVAIQYVEKYIQIAESEPCTTAVKYTLNRIDKEPVWWILDHVLKPHGLKKGKRRKITLYLIARHYEQKHGTTDKDSTNVILDIATQTLMASLPPLEPNNDAIEGGILNVNGIKQRWGTQIHSGDDELCSSCKNLCTEHTCTNEQCDRKICLTCYEGSCVCWEHLDEEKQTYLLTKYDEFNDTTNVGIFQDVFGDSGDEAEYECDAEIYDDVNVQYTDSNHNVANPDNQQSHEEEEKHDAEEKQELLDDVITSQPAQLLTLPPISPPSEPTQTHLAQPLHMLPLSEQQRTHISSSQQQMSGQQSATPTQPQETYKSKLRPRKRNVSYAIDSDINKVEYITPEPPKKKRKKTKKKPKTKEKKKYKRNPNAPGFMDVISNSETC